MLPTRTLWPDPDDMHRYLPAITNAWSGPRRRASVDRRRAIHCRVADQVLAVSTTKPKAAELASPFNNNGGDVITRAVGGRRCHV